MKHLAPVVALTLTAFSIAGGAVAAEMPKDFQGKWCSNFPIEDFVAHRDYECESGGHENPVEITATEVKGPHISCVVRKITKFDACPYGMIFRNRARARVKRPGQINSWGPGYHIVFQCGRKTVTTDWAMERNKIAGNLPRDYRCPWDRTKP